MCVELIYYKMEYIVMHLLYRKVYMCILAKIFYVLFVIVVSTLQKIFMLIFDLVLFFNFYRIGLGISSVNRTLLVWRRQLINNLNKA